MSPSPRLPPLLRRLDTLDEQPLVHLWSWPASGSRSLLAELVTLDPGRFESLDPEADPLAARQSSARPCLLWWSPRPKGALLESLAAACSAERRLLVASPYRPLDSRPDHRLARIRPQELLLDPEESRRLLPELGATELEALWRKTGGWLGPMTWQALDPGGWRRRFADQVLSFFDEHELRVIRELVVLARGATEGRIDSAFLGRWRLARYDQGDLLMALERVIHGWGLLAGGDQLRGIWAEALDQSTAAGSDVGPLGARMAVSRALWEEVEQGAPSAGGPAEEAGGPRGGASVEERPRIELELLGEPRIIRHGEGRSEPLRWRLQRAFQVVAFLALHEGRRARKGELVEALWPEASESVIRRNFHPTLSVARRTLSDGAFETLVASQGTYSLSPGVDWRSDVEIFETALEAGRVARGEGRSRDAIEEWVRAWRLYRGPLLGSLDAVWVVEPRQRLRRQYLRLLRRLGELAGEAGELGLAIDVYRTVLIEEPFEEPVHRALMELYGRRGRRDLVRRQYVRLQELLLDDLGIEPSTETQNRYHELMR